MWYTAVNLFWFGELKSTTTVIGAVRYNRYNGVPCTCITVTLVPIVVSQSQRFNVIKLVLMDRSATVNNDHLQQYMVNFNPIAYDYIVTWQSDLANTNERPLHKPSQDHKTAKSKNLPHWAELKILRNGALFYSSLTCMPNSDYEGISLSNRQMVYSINWWKGTTDNNILVYQLLLKRCYWLKFLFCNKDSLCMVPKDVLVNKIMIHN